MESIDNASARRAPWNKGKLVGQKAPLKQREIWAIRIRLQLAVHVNWRYSTSRWTASSAPATC